MTTRIAYLLYDPGIAIGGHKGASVHVHKMTQALVELGAEVTIYATSIQGEAPKGVRVFHIPLEGITKGPTGDANRIAGAYRFEQEVGRALENDKIDLIYERLSLFFEGGASLAKKFKVPRIVEVNAPVTAERIAHFGLSCQQEGFDKEAAAITGADVVAVSQPLAQYAFSLGAKSATVIPNGADIKALGDQIKKEDVFQLKSQLGLNDNLVVGFLGSLKPWHGVEVLLEAASLASKQIPLNVLIVGQGPMRQKLEDLTLQFPSSIKVYFTGAVDMEAVGNYLALMDISVASFLPQKEFYFSPLKIIESMAAQVPVIASNYQSISDLVQDGALLVTPGQVQELCESIKLLAKDKNLRILLAKKGSEIASKHSWINVASQVLKLGSRLEKELN